MNKSSFRTSLCAVLSTVALVYTAHAQDTSGASGSSPYLLDPSSQYQDSNGTNHAVKTLLSTDMNNQPNGVPKLDANGNIQNKVVGDVSSAAWGAALTLEQYIEQAVKDTAANTAYTGDMTKAYFTVGNQTVRNTLSAWLSNTYDVRAYGAACNGINDDTTAIQNAVTAAGANNVVKLPTGVCLVSAPIKITSRQVTLTGDGPKASFLINTSPASGSNNVLSVSADSALISNLSVGTSVATGSTDPAIKLTTANTVLRDVAVAPYTTSTGSSYFYSEGIDAASPPGETSGSLWLINDTFSLKPDNAGAAIRTTQYNTFVLGGEITGAGIGISGTDNQFLSVSGTHLVQPIIGVQVAGAQNSVIASDVVIDAPSQNGVTYSSSSAMKASFYGTVNGNAGSIGIGVNSPCTSCQILVGGKITNMTTGIMVSDRSANVSLAPSADISNNSVAVDSSAAFSLNRSSFNGNYSANYSSMVSDGTAVFKVDDYSTTAKTDVSKGLTAAITAACNAGGGDVVLSTGSYTLSSSIPVTCPIHLRGSGYNPTLPKGSGTWLDISAVLTSGKGYLDVKAGGSLTLSGIGVYEEQTLPSTSNGKSYTPQQFQPVVYVESGGSLDLIDAAMTNAYAGVYAADGASSVVVDTLSGQFLKSALSVGQTLIPAHVETLADKNYWEQSTLSGAAILSSAQILNLDAYLQQSATPLIIRGGAYHHIGQVIGYSVDKVLDISSTDNGSSTSAPTFLSVDTISADHSAHAVYVEDETKPTEPTLSVSDIVFNGADATFTSETPIGTSSAVYAGSAKALVHIGSLSSKNIADAVVTLGSTTACSSVMVNGVVADFTTSPSSTHVSNMAACPSSNNTVSFGTYSANPRADGTSVSYGTAGKLYVPMISNVIGQ